MRWPLASSIVMEDVVGKTGLHGATVTGKNVAGTLRCAIGNAPVAIRTQRACPCLASRTQRKTVWC